MLRSNPPLVLLYQLWANGTMYPADVRYGCIAERSKKLKLLFLFTHRMVLDLHYTRAGLN